MSAFFLSPYLGGMAVWVGLGGFIGFSVSYKHTVLPMILMLVSGFLAANIAAGLNPNDPVTKQKAIPYVDSTPSKFFDSKGRSVRGFVDGGYWEKEWIMPSFKQYNDEELGKVGRIWTRCFDPPLASDDFGPCKIHFLGEEVNYGKVAVVDLHRFFENKLNPDTTKMPKFIMEIIRQRHRVLEQAKVLAQ